MVMLNKKNLCPFSDLDKIHFLLFYSFRIKVILFHGSVYLEEIFELLVGDYVIAVD